MSHIVWETKQKLQPCMTVVLVCLCPLAAAREKQERDRGTSVVHLVPTTLALRGPERRRRRFLETPHQH
jgi:hypothetical protein